MSSQIIHQITSMIRHFLSDSKFFPFYHSSKKVPPQNQGINKKGFKRGIQKTMDLTEGSRNGKPHEENCTQDWNCSSFQIEVRRQRALGQKSPD